MAGNKGAIIPGANAARWRQRCHAVGGLLFTEQEINALNQLAIEGGVPIIDACAHPVLSKD